MKILSTFFIPAVFLLLSTTQLYSQFLSRHEAENAYFTGGNKLTSNGAYSEGSAIDIGGSVEDTLAFTFASDAGGQYTLLVGHVNGDENGRPMQVVLNGAAVDTAFFPYTGGNWFSDIQPGTIEVVVNLVTGENNVSFVNVFGKGPNIDFVDLYQGSVQKYNINITVAGNGLVSLTPEKEEFLMNEEIMLHADPDPGYIFTGWTGDTVTTENPLYLTVTSDINVSANFAVMPDFINVSVPWKDFLKQGGSASINVKSNVDVWSASASEAWITLPQDNYTLNDTVTIMVAENTTGNTRNGKVIFSAGEGIGDTVEVLQYASEYYNEMSPMAINLNGVNDYSTEIVWKDLAPRARAWMSLEGLGNDYFLDPEKVDDLGYLIGGETGQTIIIGSDNVPLEAGNYHLIYKGTGDIELTEGTLISTEPGKKIYQMPANQKFNLRITSNNVDNPIHEIHIFHEKFEDSWQSEPFHPIFLDNWKTMKVIRFMDWMHTNGSLVDSWDDMRSKDHFMQGDYQARDSAPPVAWEWMVELVNTLHADAWFCMPHMADDNFVRTFAEKIRDNLDPELDIYIEYSNETWNWSFDQCYYMIDQGKALGFDHPSDDAIPGFRYYGYRSAQIMDIWYDVFKGQTDRLVRLLNTQANRMTSGQTSTSFKNTYEHIDAIAIAPYWGRRLGFPPSDGVAPAAAVMTVDQLLDDLYNIITGQDNVTDKSNVDQIKGNVPTANQYNMRLIAYEGGQHLVGRADKSTDTKWDQILAPKFFEANRHPRMYDLYMKQYDVWKDLGGGLYAAFASCGSWSNFGSWGLMEYMTQPLDEAPKYRATIDWSRENQIWWPTDQNKPSTPDNLQVTNKSGTSLTLNWDASTDDGKVTRYDVYVNDTFTGAAVNATSYQIENLKPGTAYNIYLIARDDALNTSEKSEVLAVSTTSGGVGMEFNQLANAVKLYPNPSNSPFVYVELPEADKASVTITDLKGKRISNNTFHSIVNAIDVSGMVQGVYIMTITTDKYNAQRKIIIK